MAKKILGRIAVFAAAFAILMWLISLLPLLTLPAGSFNKVGAVLDLMFNSFTRIFIPWGDFAICLGIFLLVKGILFLVGFFTWVYNKVVKMPI